jgi:hypothetical protein
MFAVSNYASLRRKSDTAIESTCGKQLKHMGDKSPKSNQKKSSQKHAKTSSANQKKSQAVAAKQAAGKKK